MIVHIPLFSHPRPRRVLIVGGGDGGVLREVCRHDSVESVTLVEIDPQVIKASRQFFPETTSTCFDDPRVTLVHEDAAEFLKRRTEEWGTEGVAEELGDRYDVIIADTSNPAGPAESLFQPEFFELMYDALNPLGGIMAAQGECFWVHLDLIADVLSCCGDLFDYADYATTMVPTYPCGQIGFVLAGRGPGTTCRTPMRRPGPGMEEGLRWYSPSLHEASFVLPSFVEKRLAPLRPQSTNSGGSAFDDSGHSLDNCQEDDCFISRCSVS